MNRKLKYSTISMMALMALKADAVGLGELVVHSNLGEPLHAEIPLLQSNGDFQAADDMFANFASQEEHIRRGLNGFLARQSIKLKLEETVKDDVVLKLTSKKPIDEPFLNFLLELKWQTGRLLKEYTVLLDPPGFATADSITSIIKPKPVVKTTTNNRSDSTSTTTSYSTLPKTPTPYKAGLYGPVQRGETLSEIAMIVRPAGYNIRLVDMMSAIQQNNPEAFINGQADLLMQDSVLKIPELSQVLAGINDSSNISSTTAQDSTATIASLDETIESTVNDQAIHSNFIDINRPTLAGLTLSMTLDKSFLLSAKLNQVTESYTVIEDSSGVDVDSESIINTDTDNTAIKETDEEVEVVEEDFDTISEEPLFDEPEELFGEEEITELVDEEYSTTVTPVDDMNSEATDLPPVAQTSSSFFRYLTIAGTALIAGLALLWMYLRRRQSDDETTEQFAHQEQPKFTPQFNIKPEYLEPRTTKTKTEAEEIVVSPKAASVDETDKNYIDTVVMSPEEFKSAGIDINRESEQSVLSDKEIENISSDEDESLIKDYLDTVEIPVSVSEAELAKSGLQSKAIIDDSDENVLDVSEQVLDISVPLNHEDNEVNEIISDILEGEEFSAPDNEAKTVQEQAEDGFEIDEILELEPEHTEPKAEETEHNIEDLVVNFQNTSPEREFEREVSVFMAYGDYNGAEVLIEDALKTDPQNPIYKLALLSLYKATGKYGAALILSEELSTISDKLSDQDRKKLELLSDDLHDDDNNITIAS